MSSTVQAGSVVAEEALAGMESTGEDLACVPDRHQAWVCVQSPSDHELVRSSLLHDGLLATDLTLDLLSSPPSRVLSAPLEFAVGLRLANHRRQPVRSEHINKLAAWIGVGQIAREHV